MQIVINIKLTGNKEAERELMKGIDRGLDDLADFILTRSQELVPVDESMLKKSGHTDKTTPFSKSVFYDAPHACIVGGNYHIKTDYGKQRICGIKEGEAVLSKDGKYHQVRRVIKNLSANTKPDIICLESYGGYTKGALLLTADHLVLTERCGIPVWEPAGMLKKGDLIFRMRKKAWNKDTGKYIDRICKTCGIHFSIESSILSHSKGYYCSKKCYHLHTNHNRAEGKTWKLTYEQRLKQCGQNNPAWNGGSSKHPYGYEWTTLLKNIIRERDNYTCRLCGALEIKSSYSFHVHHIDGNKFNNNIENLITLCSSCHGKQQWRDAELIDIDLSIFKPVPLIKVERLNALDHFKKKGSLIKTKLYDLSIDGENSFLVHGILVHNSFIEYGTRPHWPPIEPLAAWAIRVLQVPKAEAQQVGFLIARKIAAVGTEPSPFLRPSIDEGRAKAAAIIMKAMRT